MARYGRLAAALAWTVFALVPKAFEALVYGLPIKSVVRVLKRDIYPFISGLIVGLAFYIAWFVLATADVLHVDGGGLCAFYVSVQSYLLGCVAGSFVVANTAGFRPWVAMPIPASGYIGLLIGQGIAFPEVTFRRDTDERWDAWCRFHPDFPLLYAAVVVIVVGFLSVVGAFSVGTVPAPASRRRERPVEVEMSDSE